MRMRADWERNFKMLIDSTWTLKCLGNEDLCLDWPLQHITPQL